MGPDPVQVIDEIKPLVWCPDTITVYSELRTNGAGEVVADALLTQVQQDCTVRKVQLDKFEAEKDRAANAARCILVVTDNHNVRADEITIRGAGKNAARTNFDAGRHTLEVVAEDQSGNSKIQRFVLIVVEPDDVAASLTAIATTTDAAAVAERALTNQERTSSGRTELIKQLLVATSYCYLYRDPAVAQYLPDDGLEKLALAMFRLARGEQNAKALTFDDTLRLTDGVKLLLRCRRDTAVAAYRAEYFAECGDGTCAASETCQGCAADCGQCQVQAALATQSSRVTYRLMGSQKYVDESPLSIITQFGERPPSGFGKVAVTVLAARTPPLSKKVYNIKLSALDLEAAGRGYADPSSSGPSGHLFLGATFLVDRLTTNANNNVMSRLELDVDIDVTEIERWIPAVAGLKLFYYNVQERSWVECAATGQRTLKRKASNGRLVYSGYLDKCYGEQIALFLDRRTAEIRPFEVNVADSVGIMLAPTARKAIATSGTFSLRSAVYQELRKHLRQISDLVVVRIPPDLGEEHGTVTLNAGQVRVARATVCGTDGERESVGCSLLRVLQYVFLNTCAGCFRLVCVLFYHCVSSLYLL